MAGATVVVRQRAECGDRRATQHEFVTVERVGDQAAYKTAYCNTRSMGDLGSNSLRGEEKNEQRNSRGRWSPPDVRLQGEDQREDARRNRRAARSQARGR